MGVTLLDVEEIRTRYSSLRAGGFAFLDSPGGSQVPDEVGEAIARTLREASANLGAPYETGRRVEEILERARADAGRFLDCSPDDVVFGANMTTLDFALSRTAARDCRTSVVAPAAAASVAAITAASEAIREPMQIPARPP